MIKRALCTLIGLAAAAVIVVGQDKAETSKWVDYASVDYDVRADITYSVANNTDLKLDLYPAERCKDPKTNAGSLSWGRLGRRGERKERDVPASLSFDGLDGS
jgi:hypothetical protein